MMLSRRLIFITSLLFLAVSCTNNNVDMDFVVAAKRSDLENMALLLENGANIEAQDAKHGATALMWSAHEGHADVVVFLLGKGANINARQERERTAIWYAAQQGQNEVVKILICAGADTGIKSIPEGMDAGMVARANSYDDIVDMLDRGNESLSTLQCKDKNSR